GSSGFPSAFGNVRDGKEAKEQERLGAGVTRDVLFARRHQERIAGLERKFAAIGECRADAGQNVNTFFELVMLVRATRSFARLRDRNLGKAQRDTARAPFAGDDFQRFAAGKTELLGLGLRKHASHQRALLNVFISAMPPRSSSSGANISVDFAAMEMVAQLDELRGGIAEIKTEKIGRAHV